MFNHTLRCNCRLRSEETTIEKTNKFPVFHFQTLLTNNTKKQIWQCKITGKRVANENIPQWMKKNTSKDKVDQFQLVYAKIHQRTNTFFPNIVWNIFRPRRIFDYSTEKLLSHVSNIILEDQTSFIPASIFLFTLSSRSIKSYHLHATLQGSSRSRRRHVYLSGARYQRLIAIPIDPSRNLSDISSTFSPFSLVCSRGKTCRRNDLSRQICQGDSFVQERFLFAFRTFFGQFLSR